MSTTNDLLSLHSILGDALAALRDAERLAGEISGPYGGAESDLRQTFQWVAWATRQVIKDLEATLGQSSVKAAFEAAKQEEARRES